MQINFHILNEHIVGPTLLFLFGLNTKIEYFLHQFEERADLIPARIILAEPPEQKLYIKRPVTIRAWYKVTVDETMLSEDAESLENARLSLLDFIDQQNIVPEDTFLVGYSQGGALALYTACLSNLKFKSVIGMCTYLPYNLLKKTVTKQDLILLNTYDDEVFPFTAIEMLVKIYNRWHGHVFHFVCDGTHELDLNRLVYLLESIEYGNIYQTKVDYPIKIF